MNDNIEKRNIITFYETLASKQKATLRRKISRIQEEQFLFLFLFYVIKPSFLHEISRTEICFPNLILPSVSKIIVDLFDRKSFSCHLNVDYFS